MCRLLKEEKETREKSYCSGKERRAHLTCFTECFILSMNLCFPKKKKRKEKSPHPAACDSARYVRKKKKKGTQRICFVRGQSGGRASVVLSGRVLPCIVRLKPLQLVPLLGQRGLQVQVGPIVGQLKCAIVELQKHERDTAVMKHGNGTKNNRKRLVASISPQLTPRFPAPGKGQ